MLKMATCTVSCATMLAVLFLAGRMRVTWLTQGKGNLPAYVQGAMYCATDAVLAMTLSASVILVFTGRDMKVDPKTNDIPTGEKPFEQTVVAGYFTVLKFLIMLGLIASRAVHDDCVYGRIEAYKPIEEWISNKWEFFLTLQEECNTAMLSMNFVP